MVRRIIEIDREKCNGCGACAGACHEGAIAMEDGKAKLMRDDYCDGLGDCLPVCPVDAIRFIEREAAAYDEAAVLKNKEAIQQKNTKETFVCPGMRTAMLKKENSAWRQEICSEISSELMQWPVQIKLVPVKASYFKGANLLIAADCTAYAYGDFHREFIRDRIVLVGCPKLDEGDYSPKLAQIFAENEIKSVTTVRMEVPCCGGMERAVNTALAKSGKAIPSRTIVITTDGKKHGVD